MEEAVKSIVQKFTGIKYNFMFDIAALVELCPVHSQYFRHAIVWNYL